MVGVAAPGGGERVVAAVVPKPGHASDADALRAYCRERLAAYKVPREIVFRTELPTSMLGKVQRKQVRDSISGGTGGVPAG